MSRPRLLDLFCGAGGAAMGYHRAGFDVVGVDKEPMPRYPFEFHQADALEYLAEHGHTFDAVHASPPCQDHSTLSARAGKHGTDWLLPRTIELLDQTDSLYVVENVPGADMPDPVMLCGSMFGLFAACDDGQTRQLRRHRLFHSNAPITAPSGCQHRGQPVGVYGTGGGGQMTRGYKAKPAEARQALGIDWMDRRGLSQAIPPAYTQFIGEQLIAHLAVAA